MAPTEEPVTPEDVARMLDVLSLISRDDLTKNEISILRLISQLKNAGVLIHRNGQKLERLQKALKGIDKVCTGKSEVEVVEILAYLHPSMWRELRNLERGGDV